ncbi:MAG: tetratricopeptide repeat protein [Kiritimatiellae bacterium]|nr:tetratricopeptide repeat protein [Kiritimatiellia bacterium]
MGSILKSLAGAAALFILGLGFLGGCGGAPGEREYSLGLREFNRERWVRARALLEKAIARRPGHADNAAAYHFLGVACWRMGQVQPALEAFEASRRLAPDLPEPLYNTAVIFFESGDPARAESLFQEAALSRPGDPRPLEFMGALYTQSGQWAEARRVLSVALARAPQSARILNALACVEARAGQRDPAVFYFMQALEKDSRYSPALFNLARLHEGRDAAQAESYFGKYLEALRGDTAANAGPQAEYARRALGDMAAEKAEKSAAPQAPSPSPLPAAKSYEALLKNAAAESARGHTAAALHLCLEAAGRAERQREAGKQEKALQAAVQLAPQQARAHYALGRFLAERGKADAALESFKKAVELDARFSLAQLGLAEAAVKTGEFDAALVACRAVVQQEPENPEALWLMATLYDQPLDMPEPAARTYREFERRFPGDPRVVRARERLKVLQPPRPEPPAPAEPAPTPPPEPAPAPEPPPPAPPARAESRDGARRVSFKPPATRDLQAAVQAYNRGTTYQQQGDVDRAVFYYLRAVENDDSFATAFFNLGIVYTARRDFDLAKDAYRLALERQPDLVAARYNLAVLLAEQDEVEAAAEQYALILKTHPDHAASHYALGLLYADKAGTYGLARRHYEAFLKLEPESPAAGAVRDWLSIH